MLSTFSRKSLIVIFAFVLSALSSLAQSETVIGDFQYSVKDNVATLKKYTGKGKEVTVPAVIDYNGSKVRVTAVDGLAFFMCKSMKKVVLSENIEDLEGNPFSTCHNLQEVEFSSAHPLYQTVDGAVYTKDMKTLVIYPCKNKTFQIPGTVERIGKAAVASSSLTEINIPSTVKFIDNQAFAESEKLKAVEIPGSVKVIGDNAFSRCENLEELRFNAGLESIGKRAFEICKKLTAVHIPEGVEFIDEFAFLFCSDATELSLPSTLKKIGKKAFNLCGGIKTIHSKSIYPCEGNDLFEGLYGVTVHVPQGSRQYYEQAEAWKGFTIVETL